MALESPVLRPQLRALALLDAGQLSLQSLLVAGVQKPAQLRTSAQWRAIKRSAYRPRVSRGALPYRDR